MPAKKNTKNGTWYSKFNYRDCYGNTVQKKKEGFRTKAEAVKFEEEWKEKYSGSSNMRFSTLYELYMKDAKANLKPTTYANKEVLYRLKILPYFKDMRICDIETKTVRSWHNELKQMDYEPTYLKTIHNQLSAILNFAVKYHNLKSNPAKIQGSIGKKQAPIKGWYTLEEFNEFIKAFDNNIETKLIFTIMFFSGIRSGELLALRKESFDFDNNTMHINKNFAKVNGQEYLLTPKTEKSDRVITLPDFLVVQLKEYLAKLPELKEKDRIFPYSKSHLNTQMQKGAKISGVKKIRVHDLRHSFASLLYRMGIPAKEAAEILGHKKLTTTLEIYTHFEDNTNSKIASQLNDIQIAFN